MTMLSLINDITERFLNGELMHADSVKLPDSLRFSTLIKKRDVYSGGGITPDYFVPIDTSDISEYFKKSIEVASKWICLKICKRK